jgi:hypothetical protein
LWSYKRDEKAIEESAQGLHQFTITLLTEVWITDPTKFYKL